MTHRLSPDDEQFKKDFEACAVLPAEFNHRTHIRLAYMYLCENEPELAYQNMRASLQTFLDYHGVDASKYHETVTRAWLMAVQHLMMQAAPAKSADAFVTANSRLLDKKIMLTHYSKARLFSDEARVTFVQPDLEAIPQYN